MNNIQFSFQIGTNQESGLCNLHKFSLKKNLTINQSAIIMPPAKGNKGKLYPISGLRLKFTDAN